MFRKWFNQAAEIERLQGQVKRLQGQIPHLKKELDISNEYAQNWKEMALNSRVKNTELKNGIQSCIDCETPGANGSTKYIIKKLRGLL